MILYIINIFQLLPVFISYQYDLILLILLTYLILTNLKKKIPILLILFLSIFLFIILNRLLFFNGDDIILPKFYRDLRPFVFLYILYYLNFNNYKLKNIYVFFASMVFLLTLPNLLAIPNLFFGQLHYEWYIDFTRIWSNESTTVKSFYINHGVSIPVAGIAATGQRYSSFFYMPAVSGINFLLFLLFYIYYILTLIYFKKLKLNIMLLNLILISLIYLNGIFSGSSVFQWGKYIIPLLIIFFIVKNYIRFLFIFISIFMSIFSIYMYPEIIFQYFNGITGNRYSTSDIVTLYPYLSFFEYISGLYYIPEFAEQKAFGGDSAILSKILQGGIFYYLIYIGCIYKFAYLIIKSNTDNFRVSKPFFNTSCVLIIFCELGFPATSQPLGTVIYFTLIILGSIFIEKSFN